MKQGDVPRGRWPHGYNDSSGSAIRAAVFQHTRDFIEVGIGIIVLRGPALVESVNRFGGRVVVTTVVPRALEVLRGCEPVDRMRAPFSVEEYEQIAVQFPVGAITVLREGVSVLVNVTGYPFGGGVNTEFRANIPYLFHE